MIAKINKSFLKGKVDIILSKSYLHRIMICDYLSKKEIKIENNSQDILATFNCLNGIKNGVLECNESGSTLRFMLPLCGAIGGEYTFICRGRLLERPNEELYKTLTENGLNVLVDDKIHLSGKLKSGNYYIRGDISSQYISGLLMALPLLENDSKIILTSPLASAPYVDVTLEVLKSYNIKIEKTINGYYVYGNQKYRGELKAEGDWSNGAFFLIAGAINGEVLVNGLNKKSVQADRQIEKVLINANAKLKWEQSGLYVEKSDLYSFCLDANNCPDLVPIVCVLGAFCKGTTEIENISRLKIKESDRVLSTINMLDSFGIKVKEDNNRLIVYGENTNLHCGNLKTFNDHRIAMAGSVIALNASGDSYIFDAQCVNKSYPDYYKELIRIGANIKIEQ